MLQGIFVCGDVFSFLVQASGAGMQASGNPSLGQTLIMAGLGIQIVFFALFMVMSITFHVRAGRFLPAVVPGTAINWIKLIYVLYGVSGLVLIRIGVQVDRVRCWKQRVSFRVVLIPFC